MEASPTDGDEVTAIVMIDLEGVIVVVVVHTDVDTRLLGYNTAAPRLGPVT